MSDQIEYDLESGNTDDVSVLRELLHVVRGISPVSTTDFLAVSIEEETESDISFESAESN
jgi:hypothetical protein